MSTELYKGLLSPIETLDPLVLSAASPSHRIDVDAEFITIESASEAIDVYLNKSTRPFKMSANDSYQMPVVDGVQTRFVQIEIRRRAAATVANNTVVISVGSGEYRRGTTTVAAVVTLADGATVKVAKPVNLVTPADVVLVANTNTALFAANANATRRTIRNTSTTADIRVSTTAADLTAGKGKQVKAGEEWETDVCGALYARSAGTPTLVISEETY